MQKASRQEIGVRTGFEIYRKSLEHIHACVLSSLGPAAIVLTDLGQLMANLSTETALLKKGLKACERAVAASTSMTATRDRAQAAMRNLVDKQELGEHVLMRAEYAQKFKKRTDREPLDATLLGTLTDDVHSAVNDITTAGIVLKHELKGKTGASTGACA